MPRKRLKLFVWQPALTDYSYGAIFVIASDLDAAMKLVRAEGDPTADMDIGQEPEIFDLSSVETKPQAWLIHGGG